MNFRRFPVLTATVGLWLAHVMPALAQPPNAPSRLDINPGAESPGAYAPRLAAVVPVNQQLANTIAGNLRQSGQLHHYNVDVSVVNGVVELTGQVTDQAQREEVLRIVQGVPGVDRVRDRLTFALTPGLESPGAYAPRLAVPVVALAQVVIPEPRPLPTKDGDGFVPPMPSAMPAEPMAIFSAPPGMAGMGGAGPGMAPPPMPPYAWPTYAPYNNYSRVATPELYPQQAFPFIGPMYPYPKVPLGWRAIQLKWQDGHWWYGRTATGHDYWRVRYW